MAAQNTSVVQVTIPKGAHEGDTMQISFVDSQERFESLEERGNRRSAAATSARDESLKCSLSTWIVFEFILSILLLLPMVFNRYAVLRFAPGCQTTQSYYYLNFFEGLSSQSKSCENNNSTGEFCLPWSSDNWDNFRTQSGASSLTYYNNIDIQRTMSASRVLLIIALVCCLVSLISHCLIVWRVLGYKTFMTIPYLLLIGFITALSSISSFTSAPPSLAFFWLAYLKGGNTIDMLVEGNNNTSGADIVPLPNANSCTASLWYEAGILHSVAVALLFPLMLWSLFSTCVYTRKAFLVRETNETEVSGRHDRTYENFAETGTGYAPAAASSISML